MIRENGEAGPESQIKRLVEEYSDAFLSGTRVDPDTFCAEHPECGPELRERIENFLIVAEDENVVLTPEGPEASNRHPAKDDALLGRTLDDFLILRQIGRGAMGVVYEAEQISLGRRVALKVLATHLRFSDKAIRKFQREAMAGGRQSHPGIASIHKIGMHDHIPFIAQELVEGGRSLSQNLAELKEASELPSEHFRQSAHLIALVADALGHAHGRGVIHRDVKPENILLTPEGQPKLTDFGLSKVIDAPAISGSGDIAGTPFYMAPEQVLSRRLGEIDHRADIFSLGVTLYEMLTLVRPFDGDSSHEVLRKIILTDPRDPRKVNRRVPRDLAVICLKAMEK
ncbi:MAG: serine/threonine-protein kinase, partial [Planctomycetota bacterium]